MTYLLNMDLQDRYVEVSLTTRSPGGVLRTTYDTHGVESATPALMGHTRPRDRWTPWGLWRDPRPDKQEWKKTPHGRGGHLPPDRAEPLPYGGQGGGRWGPGGTWGSPGPTYVLFHANEPLVRGKTVGGHVSAPMEGGNLDPEPSNPE
jgi:hypothetical protein